MRMPSEGSSTNLWRRIVLYLVARLTRNRRTRHLVAVLQPALDALAAAADGAREADEAMILARAEYDGTDDDVDEVATGFEGELLLSVGKKRKAAIYGKCFPNGLVAVTGARIPDEVRLVKTLEGTIRRELPDADFAQRYLPRMTAARVEMERRIPLMQKAMDDAAAAWSVELAARADLRRQYRIVYAELLKIFADNPRKANSFFRDPGTGGRAAEETGPEPGPAGSPA